MGAASRTSRLCHLLYTHEDPFVKTEIQLRTMFSHIWRHRNYSFHFKNQVPRSYPKFTQEKTWWANSRNNAAYVSKFLEVLMIRVAYTGAMFITGASYKSLISSLGIPSASTPLQPSDLRSIHTAYFFVHSSSPCVDLHWSKILVSLPVALYTAQATPLSPVFKGPSSS